MRMHRHKNMLVNIENTSQSLVWFVPELQDICHVTLFLFLLQVLITSPWVRPHSTTPPPYLPALLSDRVNLARRRKVLQQEVVRGRKGSGLSVISARGGASSISICWNTWKYILGWVKQPEISAVTLCTQIFIPGNKTRVLMPTLATHY